MNINIKSVREHMKIIAARKEKCKGIRSFLREDNIEIQRIASLIQEL